jgi:hypothetical protein
MKYLIILSILATLISCGDDDTVELTIEEYNTLTKDSTYVVSIRPWSIDMSGLDYDNDYSGIKIASDGHDYLIVGGRRNYSTVMHYIECIKCIEDDGKDK